MCLAPFKMDPIPRDLAGHTYACSGNYKFVQDRRKTSEKLWWNLSAAVIPRGVCGWTIIGIQVRSTAVHRVLRLYLSILSWLRCHPWWVHSWPYLVCIYSVVPGGKPGACDLLLFWTWRKSVKLWTRHLPSLTTIFSKASPSQATGINTQHSNQNFH